MQVVVESMEVGKLVLYPQVTLMTFGLLATSYVHLYALNLGLFSRVSPSPLPHPPWSRYLQRAHILSPAVIAT